MVVAACAGTRRKKDDRMDLLARIKEEMLPLATLLGTEFTNASTDKIVARMTVREDLCTRPAVLQGGRCHGFCRHAWRHRHHRQPAGRCDDDDREQDELH